MPLTKVTGKGITCSAVTEDKIGASAVTTNKINNDAVTSAKIQDGQVTADDLASTLDLSSKTITLPSNVVAAAKRPVQDNIALLGFKMAVNDGLTIFNLVDGVVDEFNDESGTDEAEGTNDNYCGTDDFYKNQSDPASYSAGFAVASITEPDTSTTATNPSYGTGSVGTFTVPANITSITAYAWGGGGGSGIYSADQPVTNKGGGGGFVTGNLAVTPSQVLDIDVAEGGFSAHDPTYVSQGANPGTVLPGGKGGLKGGGAPAAVDSFSPVSASFGGGGGLSGVFVNNISYPTATVPQVYMIAGGGGGSGYLPTGAIGGAGGGLIGDRGDSQTEQTTAGPGSGGGGSQTVGGQKGQSGARPNAQDGFFLGGGNGSDDANVGGGGAGYYGGGGGDVGTPGRSAGGGSSYYGHPQISCGSTEEGAACEGGGVASPLYVAGTNEGGIGPASAYNPAVTGEDGYVLITASDTGTTLSTTIVSASFTSATVATSARIVVFEENVDSPTLNTDIIASVSRDGTNFTNATLSDSGYVTGSSGQRILTGQADISGQPSGQSMRWKLALANNTVKIHGVALQWS